MNSATRLHSFVMEQAEKQPIEQAPQVYRDLAQIVGTAKDARELNALAEDIDSILRRRRQIAANLAAPLAR